MSQTFSTQPYKGTRDFYPGDLQKRNYIFNTWRSVLQKHGFEEYETSVLENAELYIAKSGEELGGSQLYNFYDKGERFIALRPEQTPSLARLIANQFRELKFPLRWFSIPNCFRYERPQKGRTREHWQLNVDIIGLEAGEAELELLTMLGHLFKAFGADQQHFKVMYNHRALLDEWMKQYGVFDSQKLIYKVLDNWFKVPEEVSREMLNEGLNEEKTQLVIDLGNKSGDAWDSYQKVSLNYPELKLLQENLPLIHPELEYELDPRIIRGIAYYTGIVFEAFDKNPDNSRALFGGGRYDDLMSMFDKQAPAVGFGWGDLTMAEFLEGWNLWPHESFEQHKVGLMPSSPTDIKMIFTQVIPNLIASGTVYEINYEYDRSQRKREEALRKRGCQKIMSDF
jgi:histidyl-tRNA synthetase